MSLSSYEIVCQVNRALSNTTIGIATDPVNKCVFLARFATTVNDILAQRDELDITDARCGNCGHGLFQPGVDA